MYQWAVFPYLERTKYEKEINAFLVGRFLHPQQALQNHLEQRRGEGRREDGHEHLEGSVT